MKPIRQYLTLAAILIALPAFADDKPQPLPLPSDPDLLILQVELKVTLQQYEKLRTEAAEAELHLELGDAAASDPAVEEARKALAEIKAKDKSQRVTKEELTEAKITYEIAEKRAFENMKHRHEVLRSMAVRARDDAHRLADTLAKRAKDAARIPPQPQFSTPQG